MSRGETEIAAAVVEWLRAQMWDVYQEVQIELYGRCADIVAVRGRRVWTVEVKRSLTFALLEQASWWRYRAHWTSVAVPSASTRARGRAYAERLAYGEGIGVLDVNDHGGVRESIAAPLHRKAVAAPLLDALTDEHRTYAEAGNAESRRWTPFQQTLRSVRRVLAEHPDGLPIGDMIEKLGGHHYASDRSALSSLLTWARAGKLAGIRAEQRERRRWYFVAVTPADP